MLPYAQELATDRTAIVMQTLKIDGRALIFARFMAMTKGEALVLAPEELRRLSFVYGTIRPRRNKLRLEQCQYNDHTLHYSRRLTRKSQLCARKPISLLAKRGIRGGLIDIDTCLAAFGIDLRGLAASAAARPVSSVPPNEKDAVTKTEQKPLKPFAKAPGSCQ